MSYAAALNGSETSASTCSDHFGIGFTERRGNTWTIGVLGKRLHLHEIDELIQDIHNARLGLVPYMDLVDKINHPAKLPKARTGQAVVIRQRGTTTWRGVAARTLALGRYRSKRRDLLPYRSGRARSWIKVKNPASPAALRIS